jgi:hypothetical protein
MTDQKYLDKIKALPREHLLSSKNPIGCEHDQRKSTTYSPQVGDLVYYFFQGHEEYVT